MPKSRSCNGLTNKSSAPLKSLDADSSLRSSSYENDLSEIFLAFWTS